FDRAMQLLNVEQCAAHLFRVVLEPLIDPKARTGGPTKATADRALFLRDQGYTLLNEFMMQRVTRLGRSVRGAFRNFEDRQLRFGDAAPLRVNPRQGVVAFGGA